MTTKRPADPALDPPTRVHGVIAVTALLWALAGCAAYLTQVSMDAAALAALPEAQRDIWMEMPAWVTGAYAVAVWSGLIGAIALLLRRRFARDFYMASLAGVVVQFSWTFLATPILTTVGASSAIFPAVIVLVGAALLTHAVRATSVGVLR